MKNILIAFLLLIASSANSQSYRPLLDSSNIWCFTGNFLVVNIPDTFYNGPCSPSFPSVEATHLYTSHDTLFGGQTYKCVESSDNNYICRYGYIREDAAAKRVYFVDNQLSPEYLLYDFSLQVGDSFPMTFLNSPGYYESGIYTLDSIRPFPVMSGITNAFYLNCINCSSSFQHTVEWLEGIGTRTELALPFSFNMLNLGGNIFWCWNGSGQLSFPYDCTKILTSFQHANRIYYDSCTLQTALNSSCFIFGDTCTYWSNCASVNENNQESSIIISPNPADDFIYITTSVEKQKSIQVQLKDLNGNTVLNVGEVRLSKNIDFRIDVSRLKSGVYFLEAISGSGRSWQRVVVY